MSQAREILEYMQKGNSITPLEALRKFGCMRLAARIADIKEMGHEVVMSIETDDNGKRYGIYWLKDYGK